MRVMTKIGKSFYKVILGAIIVLAVFVLKFISSVSRFGSESNKVSQINNLIDSHLEDGIAKADVAAGCACGNCGCGQCSS